MWIFKISDVQIIFQTVEILLFTLNVFWWRCVGDMVTSGGTNFIPYLILFIGKTFLRNRLVKFATYVRGLYVIINNNFTPRWYRSNYGINTDH